MASAPDPNPVERVVDVLTHAPAGLLTDIDGTLSPIAPTPEAARVAPEIAATLDRLAERLTVVVALSGRGADDAARLVGARRVLYVGNHGLERRGPAGPVVDPAAAPWVSVVASVLAVAEEAAARSGLGGAGLLFENKGATASIHYRRAPDPRAARAALLTLVEPRAAAAGLRLVEGRMVLELRPPVRADKGTALGALVDEFALRGAVFLGDDVTDLDAIAALRARREAGEIAGLAIGVVAAESPPALAAMADLVVDGVAGAAALLAAVADHLDRTRDAE